MNLIGQHIRNLQQVDIDGLMLSWSLGGYPSPNLELVKYMQDHPAAGLEESLRHIAVKRYGEKAAQDALRSWEIFSRAFTEFPYGLSIYTAPMNYGPANPLYGRPTGKRATMLGFPYDDLEKWRGVYPKEILAEQFGKLAGRWAEGLPYLQATVDKVTSADQKKHASEDLRFATVAQLHFQSTANQIRFIMLRDSLSAAGDDAAGTKERKQLRSIVRDEIRVATEMYRLSKADSRIGFEASNHYYYLPLDFVEKVINCEYLLETLSD
jgi:hypothetical protein